MSTQERTTLPPSYTTITSLAQSSLSATAISPSTAVERAFAPLRDMAKVAFPTANSADSRPEGFDPNASTSADYNRGYNAPQSPPSLTSLPSSGQNPSLLTSFQASDETNTMYASSPVLHAPSPSTVLVNEGTPISERAATSVSTMTPPMSPPKVKGILPTVGGAKVINIT